MKNGEKKVLDYLFTLDHYVTTKQIATDLNLTERTLREYFKEIEAELTEKGLTNFHRDRKHGVFLSDKEGLAQLFPPTGAAIEAARENPSQILLLRLLLQENFFLKAEDFANEFFLSVSTVKYYIRQNREKISMFHLSLQYTSRKGYYIAGKRIEKVTLFTKILFESYDIVEFYLTVKTLNNNDHSLFNQIIGSKQMLPAMEVINRLERYYDLQLNDFQYFNACFYLYPYIKNVRPQQELSAALNLSVSAVLKQLAELDCSQEEINEFEQTISEYKKLTNSEYPDDYLALVSQLCTTMAQKHSHDIRQNKVLYPLFLRHVYSLIKRNQRGALSENGQIDPAFQYTEIFQDIKRESQVIESYYNIILSQDDLMLLYLYFATALSSHDETKKSKRQRILIICKEGKIVSHFQKSVLSDTFGDSVDIHVGAIRDYTLEFAKQFDLILKTSQSSTETSLSGNELCVHSILSKNDLSMIAKKLQLSYQNELPEKSNEITEIYRIIKSYCKVIDREGLDLELIRYFSKNEAAQPILSDNNYVFNQNLNQIIKESLNWKQALYQAMVPLLKQKYIKEQYYEKIIENLENFGPYMIVAPGVLVAHAGVNEGVVKDCVNISVFKKDFVITNQFNREKSLVNVIIVTAFTRETDTNAIVQHLIDLVTDRETLSQILTVNASADIYQLAKKYL